MNHKPKVSVIVGLYNVEKFLREDRLKEIYNQTFTTWELILVDDGSTDGTAAFIDAEAEKDNRIRVIHKSNGGLGSARNAGLDIAQGEYICSIDVDDHVEPDMLQYCVEEMDKRQTEVMMFGFWAITPQFGTTETIQLQETEINSNAELRAYFLDRILFVPNGNGFFWNKCYRRDFLEKYNLRFADQRIQQDEAFNLKVYEHLQHCYISPRVFYHYYIYNAGNNRSRFIPNRYEVYTSIYRQFRVLQEKWEIKDQRFEDYLQRRIYTNFHELLKYNLVHPNCKWNKKEQHAELERILSDENYLEVFKNALQNERSIEQRLYLKAYKSGSITRIKTLNCFLYYLRKIIHSIR